MQSQANLREMNVAWRPSSRHTEAQHYVALDFLISVFRDYDDLAEYAEMLADHLPPGFMGPHSTNDTAVVLAAGAPRHLWGTKHTRVITACREALGATSQTLRWLWDQPSVRVHFSALDTLQSLRHYLSMHGRRGGLVFGKGGWRAVQVESENV
jgi:hypothetical protein